MSNLIKSAEASFAKLNSLIAACVAASVGLFAFLVPIDFFLRKLRWGGLVWLNEGAEYFLYFGVFLSAAWVLQRGAHVRVDIVISHLPSKAAAWLERAIDMAGAILCMVMVYYGTKGAWSAFVLGTLPDKHLQIPNWVILCVFSVSFVLLKIEFLFRYYRAGREGYIADENAGF